MRDIQLVLERWETWSKLKIENEVGYSSTTAGFKGLLPERASAQSCTDNDALIIDACICRLKEKRPDEYSLLVEHYVKNISKSAIGRKLRPSEGMIRIKFQMAEGFIDGCLAMLDVHLEMDN
ncbi:antiterminator Q family protein [Erwinia amylovora]